MVLCTLLRVPVPHFRRHPFLASIKCDQTDVLCLIALNSALLFFILLDSSSSIFGASLFLFYSRSDLFGRTNERTNLQKSASTQPITSLSKCGSDFIHLFIRLLSAASSSRAETRGSNSFPHELHTPASGAALSSSPGTRSCSATKQGMCTPSGRDRRSCALTRISRWQPQQVTTGLG